MPYSPQTWANGEGGGTKLNATRLNHMETGIEDADARITTLDGQTVKTVNTVAPIDGAVTINNTHVGAAATSHTHGIADTTNLQTELNNRQTADADLTAIANLTPTDNDVIQRKTGAWANRTPAQLKTDLALIASDVGLGNVTNTAQVQLATVDAKGDLLAGTAADAVARLAVGTNGQFLTADSAQATGLAWTTASGIPVSTIDAKGDLLAGTANDAVSRVAVGANGTVLVADTGATAGVAWKPNPAPAVATLTDGATVALDASLGKVFRLTAAGSRTMLAPTNASDGMSILIMHVASGAARTLTLTTGSAGAFQFGSDITALTETASGATDYIGCVYDTTDARWNVIAYVKGY